MQESGFRIRSFVASLVVVAQLATALPAASAPAGGGDAQLVSRAQTLYGQARYGEATTLLLGPVRRGELGGKTLRNADVLLARCYVQTGNLARAKEYFAAALAVDPAFTLEKGRATPEEIDVFRDVRGTAAGSTKPAEPQGTGGGPSTPSGPPAPAAGPAAATPPMHAPTLPAAKGGGNWIASHHGLAALFVLGGAAAVVAIASSGGSTSTKKVEPLDNFPSVPTR